MTDEFRELWHMHRVVRNRTIILNSLAWFVVGFSFGMLAWWG